MPGSTQSARAARSLIAVPHRLGRRPQRRPQVGVEGDRAAGLRASRPCVLIAACRLVSEMAANTPVACRWRAERSQASSTSAGPIWLAAEPLRWYSTGGSLPSVDAALELEAGALRRVADHVRAIDALALHASRAARGPSSRCRAGWPSRPSGRGATGRSRRWSRRRRCACGRRWRSRSGRAGRPPAAAWLRRTARRRRQGVGSWRWLAGSGCARSGRA